MVLRCWRLGTKASEGMNLRNALCFADELHVRARNSGCLRGLLARERRSAQRARLTARTSFQTLQSAQFASYLSDCQEGELRWEADGLLAMAARGWTIADEKVVRAP
jgi:hypothetical protein